MIAFDVENFDESRFVITETKKSGDTHYELTGDLTIKGITQSVTFPADVYVKDGKLFGEAKMELDRTKWDIKYQSASFFSDLGDKVIDDLFSVDVLLVLSMPEQE